MSSFGPVFILTVGPYWNLLQAANTQRVCLASGCLCNISTGKEGHLERESLSGSSGFVFVNTEKAGSERLKHINITHI